MQENFHAQDFQLTKSVLKTASWNLKVKVGDLSDGAIECLER